MIKTIKRPISILLAVLMVIGMFSALPISAGAAAADFSSDKKVVFVTDAQNWDYDDPLQVYYWKIDVEYDSNWNKTETVVDGDWIGMTYLYDNNQGQSVYGALIPDDADHVLFNRDNTRQTSDTEKVYSGSWWYIDGNKDCQLCTETAYKTTEQTASLSAAFVDNTRADRYFVLDGNYYFVDTNGNISKYNNTSELMVAEVNGTQYANVNDAVKAAGEGGEVKLIADIKSNVGIDGDYTTTLDLNGHTITNTSGSGITLYSKYNGDKTFTIKDTSENQTGAITINKKYAGDGCISDSSGRKVVIEGGTYTSDGNALYVSSDNGWTINGGTFNGDIKVVSELDVTGGTINGNINATGPSWTVDDPAEVTISGGTVNGSLNSENDSTFVVSGGTFSEPVPAAYCADGLSSTPDGNGNYTVKSGNFVAQVGDVKFETFAEAVEAANGSLIKILAKDATPYVMSVGQTIVTDNYTKITIVAPEGAYAINRAYDSTAKTYTFTVIDAVASLTVGNTTTYYSSLNSAISAAPNSSATPATVTLLKNSTELAINVGTLTARKNVVIDLGGNTLTLNRNYSALFVVRNGSTVVVQNGKVVFDTVYDNASGFYMYDNATKLTLAADLDVEAKGDTAGVYVKNGTFTSAADITAEDSFAIATNGSETSNATINITGGTLTSDTVAVYLPGDADVTISGGDITGATAVYVKSGDVTISGGTFTANGAAADYTHNGNGCNPTGDAIVVDSCGYPGGAPEVTISGTPTVTSANGKQIGDYSYGNNDLADVTATSNTMTLPEGLKWVETATAGVYEVAPDYVATVNGSGYMTFAEAVAARTSTDDVIVLIKNAGTYTMTDVDEAPIKVQNDGKTVTVKAPADEPYVVKSSTEGNVTTYTLNEAAIEYTSPSGAVSYKSNIDYSNMGSSGTYKLLKDITCNSRIVPGLFASNVTVDLNGHTLTSTATDEAFLFSRAGSAASHNSYTITNGKIIAPGDGIQLLANYADLTLDKVTINAAGDYGVVTNGTKKGNNITVTDSVITADEAGIYKPSNGALTLTNTTVEGNVAVYVKSGTVAINGGTFTGTGAKADYTYNGNGINPTGDAIVIDSCGYPGGAPSVSIGGNPTINSTNGVEIGDYAGNGVTELAPVTATDNTLTLPTGLKWVETSEAGVYEVAPDYVASVNDSGYMTFAEAVDARTSNNDVITLIKAAGTYTSDDHTEFPIKVAKSGKSVTVKINDAPYYVTNATADGVTTYTAVEGKVKYTAANGTVSYLGNIDYTNMSSSGTYQLLDDITANSRIVPGLFASNITLDLNGHTLTSTASDYGILLNRGGSAASPKTFDLVDTSAEKGGKLVATSADQAIAVGGKYNTVTIGEGVTVEGCVALTSENQTLTVNGTINGGDDFAIATNGSATKNATITVNDGAKVTSNVTAIYLPGTGTTTINGGEITGATGIYQKSGTLDVKGGTITGNGAAAEFTHNSNGANATGDAIVVESCNYPGGTPTTTISGGTFVSANGKQIGDYTYGSAADPEVTATTNTLTLPEGLKWVETDTPGTYNVGVVDYDLAFDKDSYTINCGSTTPVKVSGTKDGVALNNVGYAEVKNRWNLTFSGDEALEITKTSANGVAVSYTVKGLKVGSYTATLTDSLGLIDPITTTVTVNHYAAPTLSGSTPRLVENGPYTFTALKFDGETVDLNDYTFTSLDETVATIDGTTITPLKEGSVPVKITSKNDPTATSTYNYAFTNAPVKIGDTYYQSLSKAMTAAADGDTIVVLKDFSESVSYTGTEKTATIDLNGHTITAASGKEYAIRIDRGTWTVKDSSDAKTGGVSYNVDNGDYAFIVSHVAAECESKLILESGTFTGKTSVVQVGTSGGSGSNKKYYGGTLEVQGGTFITVPDTNETYDANGNFKYTLNKLDYNAASYPGGEYSPSEIIVKGGNFYKFNPSNNAAEGAETNFVPDEYVSVFEKNADDTYTVEPAPEDLFAGYSVSVGGTITMNVYINSEAIPGFGEANNNASATFTWDTAEVTHGKQYGNDTYTVNLSPANVDGNGYIRASVPVNAAQMANTITATVTVNDDTLDEIGTFSVKEYAETIIAGNYDAETKTLVKKMLNYGAMAQKVFVNQLVDKPEKLANAGLSENDRTAIATEMNNVTSAKIIGAVKDANGGKRGATVEQLRAIGTAIGGKWYTTSVIFLDGNTIRHYFDDVNEGVMNHAGAAGVQDTWFYYVEKKDIAASQLDTLYTFTIGGQSFQYSVLDYAAAVLESNMGDDAENLAKALYLYNQAANACFGN